MLLKRLIRFRFMIRTLCGAKRRLCFLVVKEAAPVANEIECIGYGCFPDAIQISRCAAPQVRRGYFQNSGAALRAQYGFYI